MEVSRCSKSETPSPPRASLSAQCWLRVCGLREPFFRALFLDKQMPVEIFDPKIKFNSEETGAFPRLAGHVVALASSLGLPPAV